MKEGLNFIIKNKYEYKEVSDNQCCVKTCPLCFNDNWKFFIEKDTALWDCKVCGENGNLYQLKGKIYGGLNEISSATSPFLNKNPIEKEVLEGYIENLKTNKEAYEYLTKTRGFLPETIEKFKIGSNGNWIIFPHFQDGKLWNFKSRNFKEKKFQRVQGQPSVLFNVDNIDKTKPALVIVEGETDCIAATQLGITNVISLTTGAQAFPPEWIPFTLRFKEIYVCLNSDAPGQKGALKMAEKLGIEKCKNVLLPVKDVNDYLLEGHSSEEFKKIIKEAKKFDVQNVKKLEGYINEIDEWIRKDGSLEGLRLPFQRIDNVLNGFKAEDIIIVSGDTGVGKTTIALNILHHFIKDGHKCLGFFLEGKVMYYIMRMMSMETKSIREDLNKDDEKWKEIKKTFSEYPLYFYSGAQSELDTKKLKEILFAAVKLYDIEFVMIDHIQKFVKDDRYVTQEISRAISELKNLAVDLKIPILVISHIHNIEEGRKRVTMHDAKSSSTIRQEADTYITIWNNKNENDPDDDMKFSINKNRMGEGGIDVDMVFEKELAIYRERIKEIDIRRTAPKKFKKSSSDDFDDEI